MVCIYFGLIILAIVNLIISKNKEKTVLQLFPSAIISLSLYFIYSLFFDYIETGNIKTYCIIFSVLMTVGNIFAIFINIKLLIKKNKSEFSEITAKGITAKSRKIIYNISSIAVALCSLLIIIFAAQFYFSIFPSTLLIHHSETLIVYELAMYILLVISGIAGLVFSRNKKLSLKQLIPALLIYPILAVSSILVSKYDWLRRSEFVCLDINIKLFLLYISVSILINIILLVKINQTSSFETAKRPDIA